MSDPNYRPGDPLHEADQLRAMEMSNDTSVAYWMGRAEGAEAMAMNYGAKLEAIRTEVQELLQEHEPEWASELMKQRGKDPIGCRICWPKDSHWPCLSRQCAEAIVLQVLPEH